MADGLMKNIVKKTIRTKESLRETFGKADRTTDEQFEENVVQFTLQQKNADRLQRELKNYVTCLRALSQASKNFNEAVRDVYEPHWDGVEHIKATSHSLDLIWDDYVKILNDNALQPLNYYCSQFNDLKVKMAKRGRKLVDYDAARHTYNSAQASAKKDDNKLVKTKEQMNIAKKLYEDLNNELLISLPGLYDSRVSLVVSLLKTVFHAEESFHTDTYKLDKDMCEQLETMQIDDYQMRKLDTSPSVAVTSDCNGGAKDDVATTPKKTRTDEGQSKFYSDVEPAIQRASLYPELAAKPTVEPAVDSDVPANNPFDDSSPEGEEKKITETDAEKSQQDDRPAAQPAGTVSQQPPTVLFKVRATHRYTADDSDELTFEAGELICVVPCENPEDQDEGWLTGFKESSGQRGVFPENFTKRI